MAVANAGEPCNLPEDGRVHSGFSSPSGYLSRWVLPDECQAPDDPVEQVEAMKARILSLSIFPGCDGVKVGNGERKAARHDEEGEYKNGRCW